MSSRKHRPVLYEVVRRSRLNAGRDAARAAAAQTATAAHTAVDDPPAALADALASDAVDGADALSHDADIALAPPRASFARESDVDGASGGVPQSWTAWLAEGRLHLSIGWIGASVAGVALVLVLFVTFQAGIRFASKPAAAPREAPAKPDAIFADQRGTDRQSPVRPAADIVVQTPPRQPVATPPAPPPAQPYEDAHADVPETAAEIESASNAEPVTSDTLTIDKSAAYLVVQHFPRDQGDASRQAQAFLSANGVDAAVSVGKSDIRLIATRAFRVAGGDAATRKSERAAFDALKRRVKEIGKEYTRTHARGYAFDQCYEWNP